ncbi:hypothetical protein [Deinococcus kurensis]|uniref:hypothetical protein n=1 Tax=Deinococcus kurensis TaxID=2662757 RepID=UPI0012D2A225|nr:hypothetical protein [Deinococcus kurensis]
MSLRRALAGQTMDGLAYVQWMQAGLQEGGLVPLSLGNLTVRPAPSDGSSTGAWDEIGADFYRLDDALQATKPVFIRLAYRVFQGSYASSRSLLGLEVRLGTGFDAGARALTGVMGAVQSGPPGATLNSNAIPDHMAATQARHGHVLTDPGGFSVSLRTSPHTVQGYSYTSAQAALNVERMRAADGSVDPSGRVLVTANTTTLTGYLFEYGMAPLTLSGPYFPAPTSGRDVTTGALYHFPPVYASPRGVLPSSRLLTFMGLNDAAMGLYELDHLGARREFFVPSMVAATSGLLSPSTNLVTAFWTRDLT